ncbi:MAG: lysozyme, partial [Desulfobacteraceae bacterium]
LSQNQFDSLVSLVYNIGAGAFERSTLLRLLNQGDYTGAANQFCLWNKAGGKILPGLIKRRCEETLLFLKEN